MPEPLTGNGGSRLNGGFMSGHSGLPRPGVSTGQGREECVDVRFR